ENSHLNGVVPLHLLLRVLGIRVINSGKAWAGGPYVWGDPVRFSQHGVIVERGPQGTQITFPSGHVAQLPADAPWQAVEDPQPVRLKPLKPFAALAASSPKTPATRRPKRSKPEKHD